MVTFGNVVASHDGAFPGIARILMSGPDKLNAIKTRCQKTAGSLWTELRLRHRVSALWRAEGFKKAVHLRDRGKPVLR